MRTRLLFLIIAGSVGAAACGGSDSTAPTPTKATVTQVGLAWGMLPSPCQAATTMTFTAQVLNGTVGDAVVVNFTGPGLPPTTSTTLTSSTQTISASYSIAHVAPGNSATWTAVVATVGGVKPDSISGGHTSAQSFVVC